MVFFLQNVVNALQWGSFYALIALGYSMVYGVLMLFNFDHADIFMVGAYIGFFVSGGLLTLANTGFLPLADNVMLGLVLVLTLFISMILTSPDRNTLLVTTCPTVPRLEECAGCTP